MHSNKVLTLGGKANIAESASASICPPNPFDCTIKACPASTTGTGEAAKPAPGSPAAGAPAAGGASSKSTPEDIEAGMQCICQVRP